MLCAANVFNVRGFNEVHPIAVNHQRLMRESTDRVQSALYGDDPNEQLIASRLLQNPATFRTWEDEHSGLMREVANYGFRRTQAALLKKATLRLIHRKALFEYLRDGKIRGSMRQRIIGYFHPAQDYSRSVVVEHGVYLRKAGSFLCTSHVGGHVVHDPGFLDPMRRYEELYAEYFDVFCCTHFSNDTDNAELYNGLMALLKRQLEECRLAIMNPRPAIGWVMREPGSRATTSDTLRPPQLRNLQRKP
jgi:hypothetical protein